MQAARGRLCRVALLCLALLTASCTATVSRTPPVARPSAVPSVETAALQEAVRPQAGMTPEVTATPPPTVTPAAGLAATTPPAEAGPKTIALQPIVTLVLPTPTTPAVSEAGGPPVRLSIPGIGLDAPVVPLAWAEGEDGSSQWQLLPEGAGGWHVNSAYPGHGSNVVISGHHNIDGEVFRDLAQLRSGDEVAVVVGGELYRYVVSDRLILPERDASAEQRRQNATWMLPTRSERLTLITCWPYESNSYRLVVVASPAAREEKLVQNGP